jgi:hypothetical protein
VRYEGISQVWDPIGVSHVYGAEDEYDGYIPKVKRLLEARASPERIREYLQQVSGERMGLKDTESDQHRREDAVRELLALVSPDGAEGSAGVAGDP